MITVVRHKTRASPTGRTVKLTEEDRDHIAILYGMRLWSDSAVGRAFGVNHRMVSKIARNRSVL